MNSTQQLEGIVIPDTAELIRLRYLAKKLSLFPFRQAISAMGGNYRSRFKGRGMDFDEVRPYQPGDDIRSIDWRVTARTTSVHTKIFREERERPVLIATDLRSSMFFGSQRLKSMTAAEIATLLSWAGLNANDKVGGLIFSPRRQRDSRGRKSHHSVLQIIHHLHDACAELVTPEEDLLSLDNMLEDIRRVATPGTTIVLISDFHDLNSLCEKHLFELARHCDLTLCQVLDPLETELPPPGTYAVTDGHNPVNLDTRSINAREAFATQFQHRQQALTSLGKRLKVPVLEFSTSQPVLTVLTKAYGKSPRLRKR